MFIPSGIGAIGGIVGIGRSAGGILAIGGAVGATVMLAGVGTVVAGSTG